MQTDHNKKGMEDQDKSQVPTDRHFDNFNEDNKPVSSRKKAVSKVKDSKLMKRMKVVPMITANNIY